MLKLKPLSRFTALMLCILLVLCLLPAAAFAENNVPYLDETGTRQTADDVTVIDSTNMPTTLEDGKWYVVRGTVAYTGTLTVSGTVHLILEDGCDLTVTGTLLSAGIQVAEGNSLTIYAQSTGNTMGKLTAKGGEDGAGIGGGANGAGGTIKIEGGTVNATGGSGGNDGEIIGMDIGAGFSGFGGTVTITGGSVCPKRGGRQVFPQPKSGSADVYLVTLTGLPENAAVTSITSPAGYGINGMYTDNAGKLYIWLPEGNYIFDLAVNGKGWRGSGTVATAHATVVSMAASQAENVPYLDADGQPRTTAPGVEVTVINSTNMPTTLEGGKWYVVRGTVAYTSSLPVSGTAHLILEDGCDLTVTGAANYAGIQVNEGKSLSIYAQSTGNTMGKLTANSGGEGAGIGGGAGVAGGNITINGGTVTATGSDGGKDIGPGFGVAGGTITITGGSVRPMNGGVNVGPQATDGTNVNLYLVTLTGLPANTEITAITSPAGYGIRGMKTDASGKLYIWQPAGAQSFALTAGGKGWSGAGTVAVDHAATVEMAPVPQEDVPYLDETGTRQTANGVTVIDSTYKPTTLEGGKWYVVRGTVEYTGTLTVSGTAHLILEDSCELTVNGSVDSAGIQVSAGNSLSIYAQSTDGNTMGKLTAKGGLGAGIGGGVNGAGGTINISGGMVNATGGNGGGAGIGGGEHGAGIGGSNGGAGGEITINGGTVTAKGGTGGAGIGGGGSFGAGGNITINGGTVNATGDFYGAGIGGAENGAGGTIAINGGTVTATGSINGAGIGGGNGGAGGTITISGGAVTAQGGLYGASIGGGANAAGGEITISGGTVIAASNSSHKDIGSGLGYNGPEGTVTITGGSVRPMNGGVNVSPQPKSGSADVYLVTLTGLPENTEITDITTPAGYGIRDMKTDDDGNLYIWQPAGAQSFALTADGTVMVGTGTVATDHAATIAMAPVPQEDVPYLDETGTRQTANGVTVIDSTYKPTTLEGGKWYVVRGTVEYTGTITVSGTAHLILEDGCDLTVTGASFNAGIQVSAGNSFTIYAQSTGSNMGKLTANGGDNGGDNGAGIGGGLDGAGGNITINGGTVNATGGGYNGAGIGGGNHGAGGTITINGGMVTAKGSDLGAGIGGGLDGAGGNITINGGTVVATGSHGAGIGGGYYGAGGNIAINGGTVTAMGNVAPDIGPGFGGNYGTITITGGSVRPMNGGSYVSPQATNQSASVYLVTLTGLPENTEIASITSPAGYGIRDMKTDADGKLYIWQPENVEPRDFVLTADGKGWRGSGMVATDHLTEVRMTMGTVATPTASPAGGTYATTQTVTLTCATQGATIYYTLDGTTPTAVSAVYSAPITVQMGKTLKAYAVATSMLDSTVLTAVYTQMGTTAMPTASPAGGTYSKAKTVTLSTTTDGATIYYTLDGSDPLVNGIAYSAPIRIHMGTVLKAYAMADGMLASAVLTEVYTQWSESTTGSGIRTYSPTDDTTLTPPPTGEATCTSAFLGLSAMALALSALAVLGKKKARR